MHDSLPYMTPHIKAQTSFNRGDGQEELVSRTDPTGVPKIEASETRGGSVKNANGTSGLCKTFKVVLWASAACSLAEMFILPFGRRNTSS